MPFVEVDVEKQIEEKRENDPKFRKAWDRRQIKENMNPEGSSFDYFLKEMYQDPKFRDSWYDLAADKDIASAIINERNEKDLSLKQFAKRAGMSKKKLIKICEMGNNPSLNQLKKIAKGMDKVLKIEFVSKDEIDKKIMGIQYK